MTTKQQMLAAVREAAGPMKIAGRLILTHADHDWDDETQICRRCGVRFDFVEYARRGMTKCHEDFGFAE